MTTLEERNPGSCSSRLRGGFFIDGDQFVSALQSLPFALPAPFSFASLGWLLASSFNSLIVFGHALAFPLRPRPSCANKVLS
jgi:hypothetical protein